jgi:hypothetical protein
MAIYDPVRGKIIDAGSGGTALRLLGLGFVAFLLVILLFSSVARVESGHVGVLTLFGRVTADVLPEGIHLVTTRCRSARRS